MLILRQLKLVLGEYLEYLNLALSETECLGFNTTGSTILAIVNACEDKIKEEKLLKINLYFKVYPDVISNWY